MKIVLLTQTYPRFAGDTTGTFILGLAEALAALGDEVHVLLPHAPGGIHPCVASGVQLEVFRYAPTDGLHLLGYSRTLQGDVRLRPRAYVLAAAYACRAARALQRLVARVQPDVVNAHWLVPNGLVAAAVKSTPLVVSLHGSDVYVAERRALRSLAGRALGRTDLVTGSSPALIDRALALGTPGRACFVPYGVDAERFAESSKDAVGIRLELGIDRDRKLILAVGRSVAKKGFDVLLDALARVDSKDWDAVIAGEGDALPALREQARALGLEERVRFPGAVAHDALPAWYAAADVFVAPSVVDAAGNVDGLPNVVLEAMACGRAIIASEIGGIPEVVCNGRTGLLVAPGDAQALAAHITGLLSSQSQRESLGRGARQKVIADLSWARIATHFRELYREAIDRP